MCAPTIDISTDRAGKRPWHVPVDVALPCATQNELEIEDARTLIANGVRCVAEGVETQAEAEVVQLLGIAYVQGFRYRKPGPIEEFRPEIVG